MAYLNFSDPHEAMSAPAALSADPAPAAQPLSALEWQVVALAQRDKLSSIEAPGRLSIAMGRLFGGRRNPDLADPRLEALRRLAVLAWHRGYAIATSEIRAFKQAGFTMDQYEKILASISRGRDALNQRAYR